MNATGISYSLSIQPMYIGSHSMGSLISAFASVMTSGWLTTPSLWLHLITAILFVFGFILTIRKKAPPATGIERIIPFGRLFFAVPLGLFGTQHFVFLNEVKNAVPRWMPGHVFWACLVGVALIAACLSILTEIKADLAALLVGIMLFLFVAMIYVPNLLRHPHDRFAISLLFRDLSLSGAALAFAGTQGAGDRGRPVRWLVDVGRWFFGAAMLYFGVEHFLHTEFAPGVPLEMLMPPWIPGHMAWAYVTGTVLVVGGLIILSGVLGNKGSTKAAAWLGATFLLLVAFVYVPMELVHPSIVISGELDYVADTLAMSGAAFFVAGAIAQRQRPSPSNQRSHSISAEGARA
ncbi:MAG TPA: hypothetical protein VI488_12650 [Candidatus Angelobacter sp.]